MKTTTILIVYALFFGLTFSSCDTKDEDNITSPVVTPNPNPIPTPEPTPEPTPTPNPNIPTIEGTWLYDKMSITIDGVTTPEEDFTFNGDSHCSRYSGIIIEAGTIQYEIMYYDAFYGENEYVGCLGGYDAGTWFSHEGSFTIPIVVGYKLSNLKIEMITDLFELVSVSSTLLKLKSYPKNEEGRTIVKNITFITSGGGYWDY